MTSQPKPKAGLLPLYLKLYDEIRPHLRDEFDGFIREVSAGLVARGLAVTASPIACVEAEFQSAIKAFQREGVDAIVTLHLAYSPSLEAIGALESTRLPIVILDTTMDRDFGMGVSPERIMYNHGVHGVMDLASVLRRRGRHFEIVAGHHAAGRPLDRAADLVRAAAAAAALPQVRALRVGTAFAGMGDFAVSREVMAAKLGVQASEVALDALDQTVAAVGDDEVADELANDRRLYDCDLTDEVHQRSVRVGLGLRRLLAEKGCNATSVNFQAFDSPDRPANTMPFLEISKAMARGTGYGGEGDLLTAALVASLIRGFGQVTFTEVFCADWAGKSLFLSHMGEISPAVAAGRPRIVEKPFTFGRACNPAVLTCAVQGGPGALVNLAPGPDDTFSLLVAPVRVLAEDDSLNPQMRDVVRTWVRPAMPLETFLEAYSRSGGTHHSALVLGDCAEALGAFGRMVGLESVMLAGR